MRTVKWTIVCLVCVGAALAYSDNPPRKPDRPDRPERGPERQGRSGPGMWNEEEWKKLHNELEKFSLQHSPKRWEWMKKIRQDNKAPGGNRMAWQGMAMRFKYLQSLEKEDKPLYEIKLRQIQIEDSEFGLLQEIKRSPSDDLKSKLRDNAQQYVNARFDERKHRIAKAKDAIKKLEEQLAADQASNDRVVSERVDMLVREGPDFFLMRHPRRGDDGGEPSTRSSGPLGPGGNINAAP